MDITEKLKRLGTYISSGAADAHIKKYGGYDDTNWHYYSSSGELGPIADHYTEKLISELPDHLENRPDRIYNVGEYFKRMAFIKKKYRFGNDFINNPARRLPLL